MYGLEAIQAHNGWAISVVGVTIVFSGLVLLSILISQLYKVLNWIEPEKKMDLFKPRKQEESLREETPVFTDALKESARQFHLLAGILEENFSLPKLLKLAVTSGMEDPYTRLGHLVKFRMIIPNGDGYYRWDQEMYDNALSDQTGTSPVAGG